MASHRQVVGWALTSRIAIFIRASGIIPRAGTKSSDRGEQLAKVLTEAQIKAALRHVAGSRYPSGEGPAVGQGRPPGKGNRVAHLGQGPARSRSSFGARGARAIVFVGRLPTLGTAMAGSHGPYSYRMYFLGQMGSILGREDFDAAGDECAIAMATALFDACSDECGGFELWYGLRRVDIGLRRREPLSREMQETIIGLEEVIRDSHWAIAKSRRLLAQLAVRKGHV